jgi:creatinine amidohydrolase
MKHLYRTLTWPEARERARDQAVIVIPVAAIEQHGYHLPIDVDNVLLNTSPRKPRAAPKDAY